MIKWYNPLIDDILIEPNLENKPAKQCYMGYACMCYVV